MNNTESIRQNEDRTCRFRRISDNGFRLAFEVTQRCDLSCKHCFVNHSKDKPTTGEIIDTIRQLKQFNCRKLIITGGEPLLRNDLEQIISEAKSKGILTDLNSNLFSLSRERVKMLKAAGLHEASVSLYGIGYFHDELTRQKGSFDRALRGIDLLREAGITVDVHGAVWNKMLSCLVDVVDTVKKHNVSSVTFFSLIPTKTLDNTEEYAISPDLILKTISQIRESASIPIRTIGLCQIEKDECLKGMSIYGIGSDMRLVPCLLCRHKYNNQGVDLRAHSFHEAKSLLDTQVNCGEWRSVCF